MDLNDILKALKEEAANIADRIDDAKNDRAARTLDKIRAKLNSMIKDLQHITNTLPKVASCRVAEDPVEKQIMKLHNKGLSLNDIAKEMGHEDADVVGAAMVRLQKKGKLPQEKRAMDNRKLSRELVRVALLLASEPGELLDEIAGLLKTALKSHYVQDIKTRAGDPSVTFTVLTKNRPVKPSFRKDFESLREYRASLHISDDGKLEGANLYAGAPGSPSKTIISGSGNTAAKSLVKWLKYVVSDDLRNRYTWDAKPKKQV